MKNEDLRTAINKIQRQKNNSLNIKGPAFEPTHSGSNL
jgi:hypothetical protein